MDNASLLEEPVGMRMNLFVLSRNTILWLIGAMLTFWAAILVASLWFVPPIYQEFVSPPLAQTIMPGRGVSYVWEINNLSKFHQQLWLSTQVRKQYNDPGFVMRNVNVSVHFSSRNTLDDDWHVIVDGSSTRTRVFDCTRATLECTNVTLAHVPFLHDASYRMNVTFEGFEDAFDQIADVSFMWRIRHDEFTYMEVFFRFGTLMFSCILTIVYFWNIRRFYHADWAYEQRWTALLLFLLIGFNNPMFPLTILSDSWVPLFIDSLLQTTFVAGLLFYWICLFHGMRAMSRSFAFYFPKVCLIGLLWVSALVVNTWEQLHIVEDPSYQSMKDVDGFLFFVVAFVACAGIYVLEFGYHIIRTVSEIHSMPIDPRLRALVATTIIVLVISVIGIVLAVFGVFSLSTAFFSYYSLFNVYIAFQSHIYAPSPEFRNNPRPSDTGMMAYDEAPLHDDTASVAPKDTDSISMNVIHTH